MADTEEAGDHWKKPKGIFNAINAFEAKYPKVSKGKPSTPRLRKVGQVAKATTILSQATRETKKNEIEENSSKVSNGKVSTPRLRKVGHVAKATTILSQATHGKKESDDFSTISEYNPQEKEPTPRFRKVGHVAKATTILSQATQEKKESDDLKIINEYDPNEKSPTPRLRKVGHVAKAATILSGSTGEKKESRFNKNTRENRKSLVSSASSNGSHRGILKNNKITRTLSNTVKFKEENEINSTQNGPKESVSRRKLSSSGSPSSRTNRKSWEEGYHADCLSPVIKTRNVNKARNKHGKIVGRKSSAMKTRRNGKDREGSKDSTDHLNESDSKEREKEEILSLARENLAIQKNKAQSLWRRLRTMVKLTRKMRFYSQPSLVLVSSHNKTSSAWNKLRSVIVATKMANKLLRIRREESGQIPRGGGRRQEGSFDTLGK